jgi:hypothetical protein
MTIDAENVSGQNVSRGTDLLNTSEMVNGSEMSRNSGLVQRRQASSWRKREVLGLSWQGAFT